MQPIRPCSIVSPMLTSPPDFIMCLSLTLGKIENITFAAVHDSYWTHARDVDKMNRQLREAFVDLHERPLLHVRSNLKQLSFMVV